MNQREQFEKWWKEFQAEYGYAPSYFQIWQAAQAAAVPEGWQVVPAVATQAMKAAGQAAIDRLANDGIERYWDDIYGEGYSAMLAAAPKPEDV